MYVETIDPASLSVDDTIMENIWEVVCAVAGQLGKLFLCYVVVCP